MLDFDSARIIVEIASAIICLILVYFMFKPYRLTREGRYLGFPLGFGFLGISYFLAVFAYFEPSIFYVELLWLKSIIRAFAFVFIAITYYFSKKPQKNTRILWNIIFSLVIAGFIISFLIVTVAPQITVPAYMATQPYVRIFNVITLSYIIIHTIRSHLEKPGRTSTWIPLGFTLFAINQYSLLAFYMDRSLVAFTGALVARLIALIIFLIITFKAFYRSKNLETDN